MDQLISKEILFEYFFGRATSLQKRMIEEWLQQAENQDFFFDCLHEWERTYPQYVPDTEKLLTRYEAFMAQEPASLPRNTAPGQSLFSYWTGFRWLVVASVLMAVLGAGWFWGRNVLLYQTYTTRLGETRSLLLDDSSQVTLNANSSLKVPRYGFARTDREVWLTGEAFFSVRRTPSRSRFKVHTSTLTVEVLGTRFNVSDRRQKTKVVLQEGKVKIISTVFPQSQPVTMRPGDYVEHSPRGKQIKKKPVKVANYTAWRENKLIFESTPLAEVLETVQDYYDVRIDLPDSTLARKKYTGILPTNDLEVIIRSLSSIYELEATRQGNRLILQ